jgi:hypothetical protein
LKNDRNGTKTAHIKISIFLLYLFVCSQLDKPGRLPDTGIPVIQNGSKVNDFVFDPFDDTRILVGMHHTIF